MGDKKDDLVKFIEFIRDNPDSELHMPRYMLDAIAKLPKDAVCMIPPFRGGLRVVPNDCVPNGTIVAMSPSKMDKVHGFSFDRIIFDDVMPPFKMTMLSSPRRVGKSRLMDAFDEVLRRAYKPTEFPLGGPFKVDLSRVKWDKEDS